MTPVDEERHSESPEVHRPRKRKLRYPRTSNACNFCRKRKVRYSGTQPCDVCTREEVDCEYASGQPPNSSTSPNHQQHSSLSGATPVYEVHLNENKTESNEGNYVLSRDGSSNPNDPEQSRRSSVEQPQMFSHGTHVGPTSGVSFLYGQWTKSGTVDHIKGVSDDEPVIPKAPLISYGDLPQLDPETLNSFPEPIFTVGQILSITNRYFQYISPTYRYHHQPTLESWAITYVNQERQLTAAQKASVLLVCAQTLLHSRVTPEISQVGQGDVRMSMACAEKAKVLLDKEPGPPALASVQARIGFCLYSLSTFRLNECRYCFSFAVTVATALGIHRKQSSSFRLSVLEAEVRKRSFWCLYVLDGYLSVMLGRPRLIRDEDVGQPFPRNIADIDLMSAESIEDLPHHGDLEAFIARAKLAKLLARGNDLLYPLQSLTKDQILRRSNDMLDAIIKWQDDLPDFLKPRTKTMTGQRTFERQYNILKLGVYHVQILATRRCLLMDYKASHTRGVHLTDPRAQRSVQHCVIAFQMIIDTICRLIEVSQCYGSFWSTQYIALVAISTFYVFVVQGLRDSLPGNMDSFLDVDEWFVKARKCHDHLATLPPPGTQAERHQVLLNHLRIKAEKSLVMWRNKGTPQHTQLQPSSSTSITKSIPPLHRTMSISNLDNNAYTTPTSTELQRFDIAGTDPMHFDPSTAGDGQDVFNNDMSLFSTMLTPGSNSDTTFPNLDFGWESLDTIGLVGYNMRGQDMYPFEMT